MPAAVDQLMALVLAYLMRLPPGPALTPVFGSRQPSLPQAEGMAAVAGQGGKVLPAVCSQLSPASLTFPQHRMRPPDYDHGAHSAGA